MNNRFNRVFNKLIWYLNECMINVQLHSDTIEMINKKNNSLKENTNINHEEINGLLKEGKKGKVSLNNTNLKILEQFMLLMSIEKQTSIFSYTLLKGMITSYFSIFEHYIYFIGNELDLKKDKNQSFEEFLNKRIWKNFDIGNLSDLGKQEILKRYKEFYLRRNLYIHNYGFITEEYIEDINRKQLIDVIPKYYEQIEHYKVGNILPIDGTYLMMNGNSLNVIGISVTILYVNKFFDEERVLEVLTVIYDFLLNNPDYEVTYIMVYSLLEKKINLKKYKDFTLGYLIAISKMSGKMKYKKSKTFKSNLIAKYIKELNITEMNLLQKIIYFWILEKEDKILKLIKCNIEENKKCDIIARMYSYDFLCDFIIINSKEIKLLYDKFGGNLEAVNNTTINHIKKIRQIQELLIDN